MSSHTFPETCPCCTAGSGVNLWVLLVSNLLVLLVSASGSRGRLSPALSPRLVRLSPSFFDLASAATEPEPAGAEDVSSREGGQELRDAGAGKRKEDAPTSFQERGLARTPRSRLNLGLQTALFPRELSLEQLLK